MSAAHQHHKPPTTIDEYLQLYNLDPSALAIQGVPNKQHSSNHQRHSQHPQHHQQRAKTPPASMKKTQQHQQVIGGEKQRFSSSPSASRGGVKALGNGSRSVSAASSGGSGCDESEVILMSTAPTANWQEERPPSHTAASTMHSGGRKKLAATTPPPQRSASYHQQQSGRFSAFTNGSSANSARSVSNGPTGVSERSVSFSHSSTSDKSKPTPARHQQQQPRQQNPSGYIQQSYGYPPEDDPAWAHSEMVMQRSSSRGSSVSSNQHLGSPPQRVSGAETAGNVVPHNRAAFSSHISPSSSPPQRGGDNSNAATEHEQSRVRFRTDTGNQNTTAVAVAHGGVIDMSPTASIDRDYCENAEQEATLESPSARGGDQEQSQSRMPPSLRQQLQQAEATVVSLKKAQSKSVEENHAMKVELVDLRTLVESLQSALLQEREEKETLQRKLRQVSAEKDKFKESVEARMAAMEVNVQQMAKQDELAEEFQGVAMVATADGDGNGNGSPTATAGDASFFRGRGSPTGRRRVNENNRAMNEVIDKVLMDVPKTLPMAAAAEDQQQDPATTRTPFHHDDNIDDADL